MTMGMVVWPHCDIQGLDSPGDGREQEIQVFYDEGLANHISLVSWSCAFS
jgi:hypothetical protein